MFIRDIVLAKLPSATVMFSGGPLIETALTSGFTHLAEHMAFGQGLSRTQRLTAAEDAGIELNGFTTKNFVAFTADGRPPLHSEAPRPNLLDCFAQLQDLKHRAKRPLPLLLNEYEDIQHEASMVLTTPYEHAKELILHHVFNGKPLANPILAELGLHKRVQNGEYPRYVDKLLDPAKAIYVCTGSKEDVDATLENWSGERLPIAISEVGSFWKQPLSQFDMRQFDNKIHTYVLPHAREPEVIMAFPVQAGQETDAALALVPLLNRALGPCISASLLAFNGASILICTGHGRGGAIGKKIISAMNDLSTYLRSKSIPCIFQSARDSLMTQGPERKAGLLTSIGASHELLRMNSTLTPPELRDLNQSLWPLYQRLLDVWREAYVGVSVLPERLYKE